MKNGRKVVVTGRSMIQNTDIARRLGYLKISDDNLIDAYDLKGIPSDQVVIMCTGSQGEPLSALGRIANGEHKTIEIEEGDTVIISATPVPGNEKAVTRSSTPWPRSAPMCTTRAAARCTCRAMPAPRSSRSCSPW